LGTLQEAVNLGKPAATMSQGFEPIANPGLRAKAQCVLPQLELVGCRERKLGPATLVALGVDPARIVVTGDEAIELSYRERPKAPGKGIGVSLRVAWYAGVDGRQVEAFRDVLFQATRKLGAPLIPLPISMRSPSDPHYIHQLLRGCADTANGGENLDDPLRIVRQTGRCRVVVVGSYHAAVFALSQGIPAIGVIHSSYYSNKFQGLRAQFDDDCYVLGFDDLDFREKFAHTLDKAWKTAGQARPRLLEAAEEQIEARLAAYQRLYRQIEARKAKPVRGVGRA
jgi:colanic acid/amylovoran biosynthesis protein